MNSNSINIKIIQQLKDNYSYIVFSNIDQSAIIIDPAESKSILDFISEKKLNIKSILLTHHHNDHTAGVKLILEEKESIEVFSPNSKIHGTTKKIINGNFLDFNFCKFEVISTPGHTLDHVIFYDKNNNLIFSGDTLFRLGCGRVFEGTYKQMYNSLKIIEKISDDASVYCGHEYTINNLNFLLSIFNDFSELKEIKIEIEKQLKDQKMSIPFKLKEEKRLNPFLSTKSNYYQKFMEINNFDELAFFKYLRDKKNSF
jgi:hydroxyacylglutathione hydrolase